MTLFGQVALFNLKGGEAGRVHLGKGVDVVGTAQLCFNLHNQLSLTLQFLTVDELFLLEIAACLVGQLGLLNFVNARLDDLVLEKDALLQLLGS